ncbi:TonB-dependent receptor [Maribellus sediminis]|uniref:TonB-dependent receptor n=1 Tax=Maribellus sediminis TaxID=2696285 RepID=UPI0014313A25|nr:TonB-dependent receptor [Maribellus sediminis]
MKFAYQLLTFLLMLASLAPVRSFAQIPFPLQDTTVVNDPLEEITVTAFRSPYNVFNTPAPINLVLSEKLESGDALTPVDALNQIPGVLMHHGTLNTNRLTIRGIGSRTPYGTNKIKAYFGEIPLTAGDGETTLEDLENTAIKRIEVIKGPASSLYGAGLAGVILFHPKTVVKNFVQNRSTVASFGTFKNTLSAGVNSGKYKVFALGSYLNSDGYRDNNNTKRGNLLLNNTYSISEKTNLQVLLNTTSMKAFIPSSLDKETFDNDPSSAAANWQGVNGYEQYSKAQMGVSLNRFTTNDGKISVSVVGSLKKLEEKRPFNFLEESSDYLAWRAEAQKILESDNSRFVFTTGFEMFRENYDWSTSDNDNGSLISDNNEKRQYENLFVQMEANFKEKVFFSTGVNGNLTRFDYKDHYTDNGDQSGERSYKPVISPRIGMNVLLSRNTSVFWNVSHGFSTPSFQETLLPEGEVNPDIKPETGWNFEAGIRSIIAKRLQLSASYYRIYIKDLLVARRTGEDAYIGVNAGRSLHPGFEAELDWRAITLNGNTLLSLAANATLANYHFQDFVDLGKDYSGNLLPGTAKEMMSVSAHFYPSKNFDIKAWYHFNGEMPVNDTNSEFSDAFGITNLEMQFKGSIGEFEIGLKGGVQNIFDIHYASMLAVNAPSFNGVPPRYYYPGNPRNYYVTIIIGLLENQH